MRNPLVRRRSGWLAFASVLVAAATASASLMVVMDLDELTGEADRIVVASVLSVRGEWDSKRTRIVSRIELQVEEAWKGEVGGDGRLTIVQPGGTVGDVEMTVHGMPRFSAGERSLLFLAGRTRPAVLGMAQGRRPLRWDVAGRRWMALPPDRGGVVRRDGAAVAPEPALPLDELRRRVRSLIER
jgi:hypothetical protein